jgi:hypothetical protein
MNTRGGETMTKLRFTAVLLIATLGAYIFLAGAVIGQLGMNDGGGF